MHFRVLSYISCIYIVLEFIFRCFWNYGRVEIWYGGETRAKETKEDEEKDEGVYPKPVHEVNM